MSCPALALVFVNRWLCEQLVRMLLRGAWCHVAARKGAAQDRAFRRFERLVDAADCWPCFVSYMHPRDMRHRAARGLACWPCLEIVTDSDLVAGEEGF